MARFFFKTEVSRLVRGLFLQEESAVVRIAAAKAPENGGVGVVFVDRELVTRLLPNFHKEFDISLVKPPRIGRVK